MFLEFSIFNLVSFTLAPPTPSTFSNDAKLTFDIRPLLLVTVWCCMEFGKVWCVWWMLAVVIVFVVDGTRCGACDGCFAI